MWVVRSERVDQFIVLRKEAGVLCVVRVKGGPLCNIEDYEQDYVGMWVSIFVHVFMCVCVYVCVYVCVCVCLYMFVYVCVCMCVVRSERINQLMN